jgi:glycosyltransferase involved in cell wall biosynthesis
MGMGKGLDVFVQAADPDTVFLLVGGPTEQVEALRNMWVTRGLPAAHFIAVGTVPPTEVPHYLAAADVCLITSPRNEFFANETSPMKLFEYMRAGKAIIASELPSTCEVVEHGHSAYLIPPSDVEALRQALQTLKRDEALRHRLGHQAAVDVMEYTWENRAHRILDAVSR